jgi:hypothetical protein
MPMDVSKCLSCGDPLGNQTELCHRCEQEGITLGDVVNNGESVADRVERFFIISNLRSGECGELHNTVTCDNETYTADDFAIESVDEWELELEKEIDWLQANERAVRAVLPALEAEWPKTVLATKTHLFS